MTRCGIGRGAEANQVSLGNRCKLWRVFLMSLALNLKMSPNSVPLTSPDILLTGFEGLRCEHLSEIIPGLDAHYCPVCLRSVPCKSNEYKLINQWQDVLSIYTSSCKSGIKLYVAVLLKDPVICPVLSLIAQSV